MPVISRFLGIIIRMYYNEHSPAHFHAYYGDYSAVIEIETGNIIKGSFPKSKLQKLLKWSKIYKSELLNNWKLAKQDKPLREIEYDI